MTERLSASTLGRLPPDVRKPAYDRQALKPGVVHIGVGAFQRAHQAPAFDRLAAAGDLRWGVVGASLRSPSVHDALVPQDCLYSLIVQDGAERQASIIGSLLDVIVAPKKPRALIDAIASTDAHVVTVTVTEKGYKLDPSSGSLIEEDAEVRADLESLHQPQTLPGYLAAGLRLRSERGLHPLTVISCDNMRANGRKLQASVAQVARAHDPALAEFVDRCAFPNTMVDRIVPATMDGEIQRVSAELGLVDRATVRTEPFTQWVIEDRFAGARPELESAGVQFTDDVAPWEEAKLRLLNGPHSAMAYLGGLAGIETVDAFVREPWGRGFVELLWDELRPTLQPPPQLDLRSYCASLLHRFGNSALGHRLTQIAMDGSQKIPQRLVPAAIARLDRGQELDAIALGLAAWMRWQEGRADDGQRFAVDDPAASTTARLLEGTHNARDKVRALLSLTAMFPERLSGDAAFEKRIAGYLERLQRGGARATVEQFVLERAGAPAGTGG